MTKVLVPYDFSEQAQYALDFTLSISEKLEDAHIVVLHVIEVPSTANLGTMGGGELVPEMDNQIFFIELMDRRKQQFKELEAKYADSKFHLTTKISLGNAFGNIDTAINDEEPDLVIMGSKGTSGLEEILIGSNTEKVVRTANCPVVTVKSKIDPVNFKKIVFASDFREDDYKLVSQIVNLQKLFDADLYLVIVNTPSNFETTRESSMRIKTFVNKNNIENAVAEIYNSSSEEAGIVEFAEDIDADLIAMATHGHTGFIHLMAGSIAENVVNHAKRPVMTFKTKKK